ncbi:hypothetical protein QJS04_geneDACA015478 [Acorus gramineus]|uniref:Caffeoyl-CoA O-methyltransferase n=1 Tax=Acorus gramineus TaxID=55184 RepID=A0AAV9A539_ACOGR|nr:hypothetical protein QJS04_geneDACA015478 [Acorus gramineus]
MDSFFFVKKKCLLSSDALHQYILETRVYPREHEELRSLRDISTQHHFGFITTPPEEGQLLSLLLKLMNAKKTIEIGVFMGYSLLTTALALPQDGKMIAIDPDKEAFEKGLPYIKKANVENKIEFIHSKALPILDKLLEENTEEGTFDFAFVDANKTSYREYHERLIRLIRVGGLIAYDNTLWYGTVANPNDTKVPHEVSEIRDYFINFNTFLASNPRIEISQISIGDGLTYILETSVYPRKHEELRRLRDV